MISVFPKKKGSRGGTTSLKKVFSIVLAAILILQGGLPLAVAEDVPEVTDYLSLSLSLENPVNGIVGGEYSFSFEATGGQSPYSEDPDFEGLGESLFSGEGQLTVARQVYGSTKELSSQPTVVEQVYDSTGEISFSFGEPFFGIAGEEYLYTFRVEGGVSPYTFSVSEGSLPEGLSLDEKGALGGTPSSAGTFEYTISVTDSTGGTPLQVTKEVSQEIVSVPEVSGPTDKEARPQYVEDEIIIKYTAKATKAAKSQVQSKRGLNRKKTLPLIKNAELYKITSGKSVKETVAALKTDSSIEYAQPNYIYYPDAVPSDEHWEKLWGLDNQGQSILGTSGSSDVDIDAPEGWEYASGLDEVVVAVIDGGVDTAHPDLAGKIWVNPNETDNGLDDDGNGLVDDINGWDFWNNDNSVYDGEDGDTHGTHVAGTIAAKADAVGVLGAAPNVKIMPLKFIGPKGGRTTDAILAITYAASKGVKLSNNSWGSEGVGSIADTALNNAINSSGMLFVAAAGNDTQDVDANPASPACLDSQNIISVAAINNQGGLSDFSNYGAASVDIGAPGEAILSTYPQFLSGDAAVVNSDGNAVTFGFGLEDLVLTDRTEIVGTTLKDVLGVKPDSESDPDNKICLINDGQTSITGYTSYLYQYLDALYYAGYETIGYGSVGGYVYCPYLDYLKDYDCVVWFTGDAFGYYNSADPASVIYTLTDEDQAALTSYLAGGGKLLLTGRDALWGNETSSFVNDTLDIDNAVDINPALYVSAEGITGTPFAGKDFQFISKADYYSDFLTTGAGGTAVVEYSPFTYDEAYVYLSGTSMAAPQVTGVAAAILGQKNLTTEELKNLMMSTGQDLAALNGKTVTGKVVNLNNGLATQVSTPSVTLGTPVLSTASSYTISFNTGSFGKLLSDTSPKDSMTIVFPVGTVLPGNITADKVTVNGIPVGNAGQNITPVGQSITFDVPVVVNHGEAVTVMIAGTANIINPSTAGSYTLSVNTSTDPSPRNSGNYSFVDPTAAISSSPAMTEQNLASASLTVVLEGDSFADGILNAGSFTLNNAPTGTSVEGVTYSDNTHCVIALAFDGTDFDTDISNFSITVAGTELVGGNPLTSNTLTIKATVESGGGGGGGVGGADEFISIGGSNLNSTSQEQNGSIIETITLKSGVADDIEEANVEGTEVVVINIVPKANTDKTILQLSQEVLESAEGMTLQIVTPNATLELPKALVKALANSGLTLEVSQGSVNAADLGGLDVLGTPTNVETAIKGNTKVTISLKGIILPGDPEERKAFLESISVLVVHRPNDKTLSKGTIVYDKDGTPVGIEITVDRFSTFALVRSASNKAELKQVITLTIGQASATVDGTSMALDVVPYVTEDGFTQVPIRFISEALGAQVKWIGPEKKVIISDRSLGEITLFVNPIPDGQSAHIVRDRTFVPLRFVSESLGATVDYSSETKQIKIVK